jgi:hypothetical protein
MVFVVSFCSYLSYGINHNWYAWWKECRKFFQKKNRGGNSFKNFAGLMDKEVSIYHFLAYFDSFICGFIKFICGLQKIICGFNRFICDI